VRLGERRASRAACLSCGLCAQMAWPSRYCGTTVPKLRAAGRTQCGEDGHSSRTDPSEAPVRPIGSAARGRSILGTVGLLRTIDDCVAEDSE
jgi:hypothetical protein